MSFSIRYERTENMVNLALRCRDDVLFKKSLSESSGGERERRERQRKKETEREREREREKE
jgi:hypothetical protein